MLVLRSACVVETKEDSLESQCLMPYALCLFFSMYACVLKEAVVKWSTEAVGSGEKGTACAVQWMED